MDPSYELFNNVAIQLHGTVSQRADLLEERLTACVERGYHRADQETKDNFTVCYDCETFTDGSGLPYRIEPHS
ncbi:hypothetical protein HOI26_03530 [Candidatus Woesearchaeota archaeon]|nr:hypothetical protein [Candidatus Woesearchaeota archaeon]